MIDLNLLRTNPDVVRAAIKNKSASVDLDLLLQLDREHVAMLQQVEEMASSSLKS